jgi:uncharacterized membrane protein
MKLPKNLGLTLLSIWLILIGLSAFVNLGEFTKLLNVLAIAAGAVLLLRRQRFV